MEDVIFLDENVVDVFISDRDDVDIDEPQAEGLLLSLITRNTMSHGEVRSHIHATRAILRMLSSISGGSRHLAGKRGARNLVHPHPLVDPVRVVAWPDVHGNLVRMSDSSFLANIQNIRKRHDASHSEVTKAVEQLTCPFQTPIGIDAALRTYKGVGCDAVAVSSYRHLIRCTTGDASNIVGVSLSLRRYPRRMPVHAWDVDAYLASLRSLKVNDEASVYEAGARKPTFAGTVTLVTSTHVTIEATVATVKWSQRIPTNTVEPGGVFVNTPSPKLPLHAVTGAHLDWEALSSWLTPTPLHAAKAMALKGDNVQSFLEKLGWPDDAALTASDWAVLAQLVGHRILKSKPKITVDSAGPEHDSAGSAHEGSVKQWIDAGAYHRNYARNTHISTLMDAWSTVRQPDAGMLAVLSAMLEAVVVGGGLEGKQESSESSVELTPDDRTRCVSRQTPCAVIGRFSSGSSEDADIHACTDIAFLDFGGLRGVVARLDTDNTMYKLIGSHVLRWSGMQFPTTQSIIERRKRSPLPPAVPAQEHVKNIQGHAATVATYLRGLRRLGSERSTLGRATFLFKKQNNKMVDAEFADALVSEDVANYSPYNAVPGDDGVKVKKEEKQWDYGNLLELLCVATGLSLNEQATRFVINNAVFVNPLELYMKRLRRAIQVLKGRRQQNMVQWKGGARSYQVHEDRLVAKMRRDTMGLFCMRTMACYAALITLGGEQGVVRTDSMGAYPCGGKAVVQAPISCAIVDVLRDGLALPCDEAALQKMISALTDEFRAAKKMVPAGGGQGIATRHVLTRREETGWNGFRPVPSRRRPVLEDIEDVVRASPVTMRNAATNRCCQADMSKAPFYFADHEQIASAMSTESDSAAEARDKWLAQAKGNELWKLRCATKPYLIANPVNLVPKLGKLNKNVVRINMSSDERPLKEGGTVAWRAANPDYEHLFGGSSRLADDTWAREALNTCRAFLNKACESVGRLENLGNLLVPHTKMSLQDLQVRQRIAIRFIRTTLPTIFTPGKVKFIRVDALDTLAAPHGKRHLAVVVSVIVSNLRLVAPSSAVMRVLLDDLRQRIEFNVVNEDDLRRSVQKEREEKKAVRTTTDLNPRKTDDLGMTVARTHVGIRQGLGAMDRDDGAPGDDITYD